MMLVVVVLGLSAILAGVRFFQGPTWPDRVLIFDLLTSIMIAATILYAISVHDKESVSVVLVLALLSFVSSISLIFYLEHSGRRGK